MLHSYSNPLFTAPYTVPVLFLLLSPLFCVNTDGILEGEERFIVALTSTDNNADLSVTHRNAELIIQADPGSSGHVEVVPDYRQVIVAEPDAMYDGTQVGLLL